MHRCPESFKLRCAALLASALLSGCMSVPVPELPAQVPAAWSQAAGERARGRSAVLVDGVGRSRLERAGRGSVAAQPGPGTIRARCRASARSLVAGARATCRVSGSAPARCRTPRPRIPISTPASTWSGSWACSARPRQQAAGQRGRRPGRRSRAGPARVGGRGRGAQLSGPGRGQRSDRAADADGRAGPRGRAAGAGAAEHPPGHAAGRRHGQRAPAAHPGRAGVDAPGGRPVGARAGAAAGPRRAGSRLERGGAVAGACPVSPWGSAGRPAAHPSGHPRGRSRSASEPPQNWAWRARRCIRA